MADLKDLEVAQHREVVENLVDTKPPVLKLDANGLPLDPQPSDHEDDPLVCPNTLNL